MIMGVVSTLWPYIVIIWNLIWTSIQVTMALINVAIQTALTVLQAIWLPFWNMMWATVQFVWNIIKTVIEGALRIIQGIIQVVTGIISGDWDKVWQGIQNIVGGVWDTIIGLIGGAIEYVKAIITNGLDMVVNFFKLFPGKVMGALHILLDKMLQFGKAIIQGLWDGIQEIWDDMMGWLGKAVEGLGDFVGGILGIKSPSRVFFELGSNTMKGFELGLQKGYGRISGLMDTMSADLTGNFSPELNGVGVGGSSRSIVVAEGAVQLIVQGSLDSATVPKVQEMLDTTVDELRKMLES
jgi:phage-related protein